MLAEPSTSSNPYTDSYQPAAKGTFSQPEPVACFSIQAQAEPSVMPRVLELFAKRGLIPNRWHSDLGGRRQDELTIDLQVEGLGRDKAELIAHAIRQFVSVTSVLTSEKLWA